MTTEKQQYFTNPVLPGDYADPTVARLGEDFYFTCSSATGITIWHSKDLVSWEYICNVAEEFFEEKHQFIWAPDITYHNGLWYIYFPHTHSNWVTTAKSPEGPWSTPIDLKVGGIDPGHIVDVETGKRYLHLSGGYMAELSDDGLSVTTPARKVYDGWDYPLEWHCEGKALESPKLIYHNGYYYLSSAEGGTAGPPTSHMLVSARSKTPFGPWENSPYNPIVHTYSADEKWWSKGHGTLIDAPDGSWWVLYHAYENGYHTLGRQILIEPVEWTEDGWFRIKEGIRADGPIPKIQAESMPNENRDFSDSFTKDSLHYRWLFFNRKDKENLSLTGEGLQIKAKGTSVSEGVLMTCLTTAHSYETQVELDVTGEAVGGILVYYDERLYRGIRFDGDKIGLQEPGRFANIGTAEKKGKIFLKLIMEEHIASLHYSNDGSNWTKLETSYETSSYNHNVLGGYLSLRVALCAFGEGTVTYKDFSYRELKK